MNSKKRRRKRTSTARKRAESFLAESDELVSPSDYIGGLDTIRPNDQLQLILRVSRPQQRTLPYQFRKLRQAAVERGARVIDVDWRKGSGVDPEWLQEAAEQALREGAKLFATDVTRFIRSAEYNKHNQSAQVSKSDLEALKELTLGVPLVTLLDPDKLSGEVRRFQSDLGKDSSDKRIGRPPYPDKDELLPVMLELHAQGKSYRKISELTGVSKSRVGVWIAEVSRNR
ncbi:hypothetical protein [Gimesia chilikensis]|uniref:hypothetical protein n=1 Tax=Gimesia chilikensis TaxID=2605989 RepID=UPI003A8EBAF0